MAKAAAQIMKINGETIASLNFGSMSAAYSSVGELNILTGKDQLRDRFHHSRQQKKAAINSTNTTTYTATEQLYNQMQNIVQLGSESIKSGTTGEIISGAPYGGSITNGGPASVNTKKYSQSVTRRNHAAIQDTGIAKNPEMESQESNKNFNSLRNSRSMTKKHSTTVNKKNKKLKKSESQARHQQMPKSELLTTQHIRLPDDVEVMAQHTNY